MKDEVACECIPSSNPPCHTFPGHAWTLTARDEKDNFHGHHAIDVNLTPVDPSGKFVLMPTGKIVLLPLREVVFRSEHSSETANIGIYKETDTRPESINKYRYAATHLLEKNEAAVPPSDMIDLA